MNSHLRQQIMRFVGVGIINTLVDVMSYAVMLEIGLPLGFAIVISTSLGMLCSYTLNRRFTFQTKRHPIIQFLLITLSGLWVLQPIIIIGLQRLFMLHGTLPLTIAKLIATAVSMVWNFVGYRLIFHESSPHKHR